MNNDQNSFKSIDKIHLLIVAFIFVLQPLVVISIRFESELAESLFNVIVLIAFFSSALVCYQHKSIYFPFRLSGILLIIFGLYCTIHYFMVYQYLTGFRFILSFLILLLLSFSILQAIRHSNAKIIFMILFFVQGVFQTFVGLHQRFISFPYLKSEIIADTTVLSSHNITHQMMLMDRVDGMLPYGTLIYPNAFGVYLVLHLINAVGLFLILKSFFKKHLILFFVFIVFVILPAIYNLWLTEAKGVFLSFIVSIGITSYIYFWFKKNSLGNKYFWLSSLSLLFIGCVVAYKIAPEVLSLKVRLDYWHAGWNMMVENSSYFFGLGVGGFTERYTQFKLANGWEVQKPHNYFVFTLVSYGFIGLVLFVSCIVLFVKDFMKNHSGNVMASQKNGVTLGEGFNPMLYQLLLVVFFVFTYVIPMITGKDLESMLAIMQLFVFMVLIINRLRINRQLFVPLEFEKSILWQVLLLISFLAIFYINLIPTIFKIGNWILIDELDQIEVISLSALLLLGLLFAVFKTLSAETYVIDINSNHSQFVGLFLFTFFILMIFGDMTFHFPAIVSTVIVLLVCYRQISREILDSDFISLPERKKGYSFLSFICIIILVIYSCFIKNDLKDSLVISDYQLLVSNLTSHNNSLTKEELLLEKLSGLKRLSAKVPTNYSLRKDLVNVHNELASHYDKSGNSKIIRFHLEESLKNLNKMIELKPFFAPLYNEKAAILEALMVENGQIEEAHKKACNLYPFKATYHYELGNFYKRNQQYKLSKESYQRAIECHKLSDRRTKLNKEESINLKKNYLEIQQQTE